MQPTEMADFLERMAAVLALAPAPEGPGRAAAVPPGEGCLLAPPSAGQTLPPRTLGTLCSVGQGLWPGLAAESEAEGDPGLAALCRALDAGLADGSLCAPKAWRLEPRISEFVYPVI